MVSFHLCNWCRILHVRPVQILRGVGKWRCVLFRKKTIIVLFLKGVCLIPWLHFSLQIPLKVTNYLLSALHSGGTQVTAVCSVFLCLQFLPVTKTNDRYDGVSWVIILLVTVASPTFASYGYHGEHGVNKRTVTYMRIVVPVSYVVHTC